MRGVCCALAFLALCAAAAPAFAQSRTLELYFTHTRESLKVVYKRNGRYVPSAMREINRFLRDWRRNESTRMDPELLDLLWDVQQEFGGKPIHVVSAYRSPATNRMLRRRSRGVARKSQHMTGRAIDFFIPGVKASDLRKAGIRRQVGGVGYYPRSGSPFVHFDTGSVRAWPRMSRRELSRIFPDGTTLHLPSDGKPLANYAKAKELESKGRLARLDGGGGSLFGFRGLGRNAGPSAVAVNDRGTDRILPNAGPAERPAPRREQREEAPAVRTASLGPSATDAQEEDGRGLFRALPSVSLGGLINRFRDNEEEGEDGPSSVTPVETPAEPLQSVETEEEESSGPVAVPVPRPAPARPADGTGPRAGETAVAALPPSTPRADEDDTGTRLAYARGDETVTDTGSPLGATASLIPPAALDDPFPSLRRRAPRLAALVTTRSAADALLTPVRGASPALIADTSGIDGAAFADLTAPDRRRAARGGILTAQGFLGTPTSFTTGTTDWPDTERFTGVSITVYAQPRGQ